MASLDARYKDRLEEIDQAERSRDDHGDESDDAGERGERADHERDAATWDDLAAYVRVRYEIIRRVEGELSFNLPTKGDRHQWVVVRQVTSEDGHPWAQITSAIGVAEQLDLVRCLALAGEAVTGGLVSEKGLVLFRHSIPLGDTALDGFERPLRLVVNVADRLREELTPRLDR
jgi:hypothetical protein